MYPQSDNPEIADMQQNIPSMALMYSMYTNVFGNYFSTITPPQPGQLSDQFPTLPYTSLEALLYAANASNPAVSPTQVITGSTSGIQNLTGAQVQNDGTGQARSLNGFQASTQASIL